MDEWNYSFQDVHNVQVKTFQPQNVREIIRKNRTKKVNSSQENTEVETRNVYFFKALAYLFTLLSSSH